MVQNRGNRDCMAILRSLRWHSVIVGVLKRHQYEIIGCGHEAEGPRGRLAAGRTPDLGQDSASKCLSGPFLSISVCGERHFQLQGYNNV